MSVVPPIHESWASKGFILPYIQATISTMHLHFLQRASKVRAVLVALRHVQKFHLERGQGYNVSNYTSSLVFCLST